MSGPRVTSGEDSKQDYGTPADLLAAVEQRFGTIMFDLAAHRLNKKHARYFAPSVLTITLDKNDDAHAAMETLIGQGADPDAARVAVARAGDVPRPAKVKVSVRNSDPDAMAFDAFKQDWAGLHQRYPMARPSILWLNCEFSDCGAWAVNCAKEGARGANITLLTPASVGANWWIDNLAGVADTYLLKGRLMFDRRNVFPKDCMINHVGPHATRAMHVWDWKRDRLVKSWTQTPPVRAVVGVDAHGDRQGSIRP